MNKWMTSGAIAAAALALSVVVSAQDKPAREGTHHDGLPGEGRHGRYVHRDQHG